MPITREELAAAFGEAAASPSDFPEHRFSGRGIVICAGGARMFTCAWVCIGMLRRAGCTLPIEVWHLGPEEMGPPMRRLLCELDVHVIDALEVAKLHPVDRLGGWELKAYALLHSRFLEILLLDADNVPVNDPAPLFDCVEFRTTGTMFWPDILLLSRNNPIWTIAELKARDCTSVESGQILLDKSKCWRALSLAHWMNQHSEEFYSILHGDKDTFLISWLRLSQPYHLIAHSPKMLEATICQRDPDGTILFQHRNGAKWVLRGVNPNIQGFRFEEDCFELLAKLKKRWDGYVFNPPPRSDKAKALELSLVQDRHFRLVRVSSDERSIELLPEHCVGAAAGNEFYWYAVDEDDELELVLEGGGYRSCSLRLSEDGIWRGQLAYSPWTPVELIPTAPGDKSARLQPPRGQNGSLNAVLDRALAAYESLPQDQETTRDFVGMVRVLAILDSSVIGRLDELRLAAESGTRRQMIAHAMDGLTDIARRPDRSGIAAGHSWSAHSFPVQGYDEAN
jgi:hypothetical protein